MSVDRHHRFTTEARARAGIPDGFTARRQTRALSVFEARDMLPVRGRLAHAFLCIRV